MQFRDFAETCREQITDYLLDLDIERVTLNKVTRNNGNELTALVIKEAGSEISPSIYLDNLYATYQSGNMEIDDVLKKISDDYRSARSSSITSTRDFSKIGVESLFVKLVNYDRNKDMLKDIPHERYMDMAVTYRVMVKRDENGLASFTLNNDFMDKYGIDPDILHEAAINNTDKIFGSKILNMSEVVADMMGLTMEEMEQQGLNLSSEIYILTNDNQINGASAILYSKEKIGALASNLGKNFICIPSSIHEFLLVPAEHGMSVEEIQMMVKEVNENVVSQEDFLSDNIYLFDEKTQELEQLTGLDRENGLGLDDDMERD